MEEIKMNNYDCWNLIIQILVAIGTLGAVYAAIWGNQLRKLLFGPKLQLELGDKMSLTKWTGGGTEPINVVFTHIKVRNSPKKNLPKKQKSFSQVFLKKQPMESI
jgi:hypothetical protein